MNTFLDGKKEEEDGKNNLRVPSRWDVPHR